jgi:hypothetical protein
MYFAQYQCISKSLSSDRLPNCKSPPAHAIDSVWLQQVKAMILRTDPTLVSDNHDRVKDSAFEMNLDWACV